MIVVSFTQDVGVLDGKLDSVVFSLPCGMSKEFHLSGAGKSGAVNGLTCLKIDEKSYLKNTILFYFFS